MYTTFNVATKKNFGAAEQTRIINRQQIRRRQATVSNVCGVQEGGSGADETGSVRLNRGHDHADKVEGATGPIEPGRVVSYQAAMTDF